MRKLLSLLFKLYQKHVNYDLREYVFANRIITIWNSLPDNVVSSTPINMFKNRLDNFLHAQDVYFNCKDDLTGTGDRSESHLILTSIICRLVV